MIPVRQLIVGITGAIVGVIGWLFVGIYINRRETRRRARNAGRAVYFELQALVLAYLGQGAYAQVSEEENLPIEARKMSRPSPQQTSTQIEGDSPCGSRRLSS